MSALNLAVVVKLEPDLSEGNISYNADGTLDRKKTKNTLGPHSKIAAQAAFYAKVKYGAKISIGTMSGHAANNALQIAMETCDADVLQLYSDHKFAGADTIGTAEVLKKGVEKMNGKMDIVFSGHRATDGETGQVGPQIAWKLGLTFLGNVISYDVNLEKRTVTAKRLVNLRGVPEIIQEVEAPLPVFIAIDPSYKYYFDTVSLRLTAEKYKREAHERAQHYSDYLQTFTREELGADETLVGLIGSPTIVYNVQRVPKGKATRSAKILDGSNPEHIRKTVTAIKEAFSAMVIK
ncbi:MAG: electron transfer flavoprotein subunit beta/FixA family protein [Nitrosopumilus sp.]